MRSFASVFFLVFFTHFLVAQTYGSWESFTINRLQYPVVSPFGTMQTHYAGLQMEKNLIDFVELGLELDTVGFKAVEKNGETQCFELMYKIKQKKSVYQGVEVDLLAFDIRKPTKPLRVASGILHNVPNAKDGQAVRCQITDTADLEEGYTAFVLVKKSEAHAISTAKVIQKPLFDGVWLDETSKSVFIYAPVRGVQDYENAPMEELADTPGEQAAQPQAIPKPASHPTVEGRSYYENGKYGMKATDGAILIPAQYDGIHFAYSNCMIVYKDGKNGAINAQNEVLIPFEYKQLSLLYVNRSTQNPPGISLKNLRIYAEKVDGTKGILNGLGEVIAPFRKNRLAQIHYFYEAPRESHGYIVTPPIDYAEVRRGTALIYRVGNAGAVNADGEVLIPFEYDDIEVPSNSTDYSIVQVEKDGKHQLYDLKKRKLIQTAYASEVTFLTELNLGGSPDFPKFYGTSKIFGKGVYEQDIQKYGIIDSFGNEIIPFEYDGFGSVAFLDGKPYFTLKKEGKFGLVNALNKVSIPFEYGVINQLMVLDDKPVFIVKDSTKNFAGMVSLHNEVLLPLRCKGIYQNNGHLLTYQNEQKRWQLANVEGAIETNDYASLGFLESEYISYSDDGVLSGLMSPTGEVLTKTIYKTIHCNPDLLTYSVQVLREKGLKKEDVVAVLIHKTGSSYAVYTSDGRLVELGAY